MSLLGDVLGAGAKVFEARVLWFLMNAMKGVTFGDLDAGLPMMCRDTIKKICKEFEHDGYAMIVRVNKKEYRVYLIDAAVQSYVLKVFCAPWFTYTNAERLLIDSIRSLADKDVSEWHTHRHRQFVVTFPVVRPVRISDAKKAMETLGIKRVDQAMLEVVISGE